MNEEFVVRHAAERSDASAVSMYGTCGLWPQRALLQTVAAILFYFGAIAYSNPTQLGVVDFPTSGPPAAQSHFLQGVLLLHNFQYTEAQNEFAAAEKIAPDFAMPYWGEAMTY